MLIFFWAAPFLAVSVVLSALLVFTPQIAEYYRIMIASGQNAWGGRLGLQVASNLVVYSILCLVMARSFFNSLPAMDGPGIGRRSRIITFVLALVVLHLPGVAVATILNGGTWPSLANPFGIGSILVLGAVVVLSIPLLLHASNLRASRIAAWLARQHGNPGRAADLVTITGGLLIAAAYVVYAMDPVRAVQFFGLVATIFVGLSAMALMAYAAIRIKRQGIPIATIVLCAAAVSHIVAVRGRVPDQIAQLPVSIKQQTYEAAKSPDRLYDNHKPILDERSIQSVEDGFADWLKSRSTFDAYVGTGRKYPIFIVAAQGGGYYAGYHTALFLARLQDQCPRFRSHLFAISGVSGGSLGGSIFAQLARAQGPLPPLPADITAMCGKVEGAPDVFERAVKAFFDFDFLSPVAASALLFDVPRLVIPHLTIGPSRADALQGAFHQSWQRAAVAAINTRPADGRAVGVRPDPTGFERPFFGQWDPKLDTPALFLNATSVKSGAAALFSELHMTSLPTRKLPVGQGLLSNSIGELARPIMEKLLETELARISRENPDKRGLAIELQAAIQPHDEPSLPFFNVLDFRPDLQIPLGAAVVASASFPLVTPPVVIDRSRHVLPRGEALLSVEQLQLVDGGFADNSGLLMAKEIANRIYESAGKADLADKIEIHIIAFTHHASAFVGKGEKPSYPEILTPLATFEAIRMARGRGIGKPPEEVKAIHAVQLFDRAFQPPLSWALSRDTRQGIEIRSGGVADAVPDDRKVCCYYDPVTPSLEANESLKAWAPVVGQILVRYFGFEFYLHDDEARRGIKGFERIKASTFVPNATVFAGLAELVNSGGSEIAQTPAKTDGTESKPAPSEDAAPAPEPPK